jgi:N-acyl-L-homoserine lactone synthetase
MDVCSLASDIFRVQQSFRVEIVETEKQLHEAYRLRYQVYCLECGFEASDTGEEIDEYDAHARHALLRNMNDGEVIGAIRIVGPDLHNIQDSFPMQRMVDPWLLRNVPLHSTGEVSRLAISKQRRIPGADALVMRMALWRAVTQLSSEMGLTAWLALAEPSTIRLHARTGIHFEPVGPMVSHHGMRQPLASDIRMLLGHVLASQPSIWNFLTDEGRWFGRHEKAIAAA